jgi:hypothetical protein
MRRPEAGATSDLDRPATLPGRDAQGGYGRFPVDPVGARHRVNEIPDDGKDLWAVIEPDRPQDRAAGTASPKDSPGAGR